MPPLSMGVSTFFEQRSKRRTVRPQFVIAILAGIAFALDMGVLYLSLGEASVNYGPITFLMMFAYIVVLISGWVIGTALIYLIARFIGARIQYSIFFRTTGWALVPLVGTGLCWSAGRYLALRGIDACSLTSIKCGLSNKVLLSDQVSGVYSIMATATGELAFQTLYIAGMVLFVVTGYMWIVVATETSTLTREGATIVVGIPFLIVAIIATIFVF